MTTMISARLSPGSIVLVQDPGLRTGWHARIVRECDVGDTSNTMWVSLSSNGNTELEPFECYHNYLIFADQRICQHCGGCPAGEPYRQHFLFGDVLVHNGRRYVGTQRRPSLHQEQSLQSGLMRVAFPLSFASCSARLGVQGSLSALAVFSSEGNDNIVVPAEVEFDYIDPGGVINDPGGADYIVKACDSGECDIFDELISIKYQSTHMLVRRIDLWFDF